MRHALAELCGRPRDPAAASSERERRPHDRRNRTSVEPVERGHDDAQGDGQAGGLHRGAEERTVLGGADGVEIGADQLDSVLREHAVLRQFDGEVQRGLAAERGEERIGRLPRDDLRERHGVQRLQVGRVGPLGVGHDRGRVRVHEHDPVPLAAERPARLHARVVELAALSDPDRPGADDQDAA